MKKLYILLSLTFVLLVLGCEGVDLSEVSEEDINKVIVCEAPYIRHASGCCLDQNENGICDSDEMENEETPVPEDEEEIEEDDEEIEDVEEEIEDVEDDDENIVSTCISGSPITCSDVKVTSDGNLALTLSSTGTSSASLSNYHLELPESLYCVPNYSPIIEVPYIIPCSFDKSFNVGDRFSGTGMVDYTLEGDTQHTATISFSGFVEEKPNPNPSVCTVSAPISCTDLKLTSDGTLTLMMGATGTQSATLQNYQLELPESVSCAPLENDISITSTKSMTCSLGKSFTQGKKFSGSGMINYVLQGSELPHITNVYFQGTVE